MTAPIDHTHDQSVGSWAVPEGHADFPIQNLPLGVFSIDAGQARIGTRIGDRVLDLGAVSDLLPNALSEVVRGSTLNALFALAPDERLALRRKLWELLSGEAFRKQVEPHLLSISDCRMHLPASIGDYTDFYTGIHHAVNAGGLFRPDAPLGPNYKWVPIAYHGRASTVSVSDIVIRPNGQQVAGAAPVYRPSQRLDYELEMGVWIAGGNALGSPISVGAAADHVAGLCLLNDWSARDVQMWEMAPLGPFLSKSFQTTISPWVVTAEALAPFRIAQPVRPEGDPRPLPYLWDDRDQTSGAFAIDLEVHLVTAAMRKQGLAPHRLSSGRLSTMYWTVAQMIAHHTSNGCSLNSGDLLGTGTISEPTDDGFGSLLEITRGGQRPVALPNGESRIMLEDGDELVLSGRARAQGFASIGFGECRGLVRPAPSVAL